MRARDVLRFGPSTEQRADLRLPDGTARPPVVALWHGGSFEPPYTRAMMEPMAEALTAAGFATLNTTYRRIGSGGGWPETFDDARAALAALRDADADLDLADVRIVGFSAGAPPAVHAAARPPDGVAVTRLLSLAGLLTLETAARTLGAYVELFGDPDERPEAYAGADPMAMLPLGVETLVLHGADDEDVPVAVSECFATAAQVRGDDARLELVPGAGHFDLHEPGTAGWPAVERFLTAG